MPAKEKRRETAAGLFVLIGLLLLGILIVQFGRFGDRFGEHYSLYVEFNDTAGIIKGSDVRLRGAKIGKVSSNPELVTSRPKGSIVRMEIRIRDGVKIPHNSDVKIGTAGIMGDTYIQVVPPEEETGIYYKEGDTIIGEGAGAFDSIKSDAEKIAREADQRLKDVKKTIAKMDVALDEIKSVATKLNTTIDKVNTRFFSENNLNNFSKAIANFQIASEHVKVASKDIQPTILEAKSAMVNIRKTAETAGSLVSNLQNEVKHIEPALRNMPKAMNSISRAVNKAEKTISAFQNKKTLAGTLAYDEETGSNAQDFMKNLKRYGILRYRDDDSPETNDPRNKFRGTRR